MKDNLNILGIGIDLVEVDRIRRLVNKYPKFIDRLFTKEEIDYCNSKKNRLVHFAGKFAAKEAVIKSMGVGNKSLKLRGIQVSVNKNSIPKINLQGIAFSFAKDKNIEEILISITHTKEYAIAIAYARGTK